jgi:hypothetical protein
MGNTVNRLSPETFLVGRADSVHVLEGNTHSTVSGNVLCPPRGLRQRYGIKWYRQELGRDASLHRETFWWYGTQSRRGEGSRMVMRQSEEAVVAMKRVMTVERRAE